MICGDNSGLKSKSPEENTKQEQSKQIPSPKNYRYDQVTCG